MLEVPAILAITAEYPHSFREPKRNVFYYILCEEIFAIVFEVMLKGLN